jgi:hypothetical protein
MSFKSAIAEVDGLSSDLRRFIQAAEDWQQLGRIVDAVDAAYQRGKLDRAIAEDLAQLAMEMSDGLPEGEPEQTFFVVQADELLDNDRDDACFCCGEKQWWRDSYGVRKCGVCHPEPRKKRSPRKAVTVTAPEREGDDSGSATQRRRE